MSDELKPFDWHAAYDTLREVDAREFSILRAELASVKAERDKEECVTCKATRWEHSTEQWEYCQSKARELKADNERLQQAIGIAAADLDIQLSNRPKEGDGLNHVRYSLRALRECVAPEALPSEGEELWEHPDKMSPQELGERFASTYRKHSNPRIYRQLKNGHDEVVKRLQRAERAEAANAELQEQAEQVMPYLQHKSECVHRCRYAVHKRNELREKFGATIPDCTCGLDALLRAIVFAATLLPEGFAPSQKN